MVNVSQVTGVSSKSVDPISNVNENLNPSSRVGKREEDVQAKKIQERESQENLKGTKILGGMIVAGLLYCAFPALEKFSGIFLLLGGTLSIGSLLLGCCDRGRPL